MFSDSKLDEYASVLIYLLIMHRSISIFLQYNYKSLGSANTLNLLQIVLADKSEQKAFKYTGITCFNPGSFANDSTFAAYRPCTKEVELSALES